MFFVIVDTYSKWPEIVKIFRTTSSDLIKVLRSLFAHYGIPEEVVSDNRPQFVADEFAEFCESYDIKHVFIPPCHPQSNGQVYKYVQTFKDALKKMLFNQYTINGEIIQTNLENFLFLISSYTSYNTRITQCIISKQRTAYRARFSVLSRKV